MKLFRMATLAAASLAALAIAPLASAQTPRDNGMQQMGTAGAARQSNDRASNLDMDRRNSELQSNRNRNDRRGRAPSPEQIARAARTAATGAGLTCQVTETALLGVTTEEKDLYEVACSGAGGYIVLAAEPAVATSCVDLAGAALVAREADAAADVGMQCTLPVNQNILPILAGYGAEAGVSCTVDQATAFAVNNYEIGCAGADGYHIERKADGAWGKIPCWSLAARNTPCRYSTSDESNAAWTQVLTGSEASSCVVQQTRAVGRARGLTIYELKCTGDTGYFVRLDETYVVKQVTNCAAPEAATIPGGCTLTTAAPAAPAGRP